MIRLSQLNSLIALRCIKVAAQNNTVVQLIYWNSLDIDKKVWYIQMQIELK